MVFVNYKTKTTSESAGKADDQPTSSAPQEARNVGHAVTVQEHPVDIYWRSQSGKIPKGRDAHFCKHGQNGMCDYCMPLEPYDPMYQAEHNIKHLSYHAYLRKLVPAASQNTSRPLPPLSPVSYRVKAPCPSGGHPSWPAGICTACQPSAITLQSQPFRMVDHLEIASQDIVERFLQAWRATGLQRFGWLIGHYEHYDKVPMGIKAVVEAIHEPPQEGELDGLTLGLPWEDEQRIKELATFAKTPLEIVGYIFTDLEPTAEDRTKNVYKRHSQSFFMSSLETIFAATVQNSNPTPSQSSPSGYFGSRMVTAILTATEDGQVDISAFQVSEQACAMVDADMIEASVEPGIVRVKEEDRDQNSARYVPDVFYRYKNEYAIEVKKSAKPCFPVEYLLVNVCTFAILVVQKSHQCDMDQGHTWLPAEPITALPIQFFRHREPKGPRRPAGGGCAKLDQPARYVVDPRAPRCIQAHRARPMAQRLAPHHVPGRDPAHIQCQTSPDSWWDVAGLTVRN